MRDKMIEKALYEMALNIGDGGELSLLDSHVFRHDAYNKFKEYPANGNIHVKHTPKSTEYVTLNHSNEEATHFSIITHRKAGYRSIPFDHDEQTSVNSKKGEHPGQSVKVMMNHIKTSNVPLVSSELQTDQGHKMWKQFIDSAMDHNYNVYYHDNNGLVKITPENKDFYHRKYFGDSINNEYTNMIVCKHEVKI